MSVTYTFVPLVAVGDKITSTQAKHIADACNDRFRANLGDPVRRHLMYYFSLLRTMINPTTNESGGQDLVPDSYFFSGGLQILKPTDGVTWPDGDPGGEAGAAIVNHLNTFVFGGEAVDLRSEEERITDGDPDDPSGGVPIFPVPTSVEQVWELGKLQRGGYDPATGGVGCPAFKAATEHYKIISNVLVSPYGSSYGGMMPIPLIPESCPGTEDYPPYPSYQIKFTRLDGLDTMSFPGTCLGVDGHVAGVYESPTYIFIFRFGDPATYPLITLPSKEWIEGPYTGGGQVKRNFGNHLPRVLNAFAGDFRGTDSERALPNSWLKYAFDTQRFLTTQYHLAPARGTESPPHTITPDLYPQFTYELDTDQTLIPGGTLLTNPSSGLNAYGFHSGFVMASVFVKCTNLVSGSIEILNAGSVVRRIDLTPGVSGQYQNIVTFDSNITPAPLQVRVRGGVTFSSDSGTIVVEAAELMQYKPELHDLYLTLRLSAARTSLSSGLDGGGESETAANELSDNYFAYGMILNHHGAAGIAGSFGGEVNTNAVFDVARRMSQGIRIIPRRNFIGYEVTNGRSICYFKRLATDAPGDTHPDLFEGMAPSRDAIPSGSIIVRKYVVRGSVGAVYNGSTYTDGQVFQGVTGVTTYTADGDGSPSVYEYSTIHDPAPEEFSNEWVMDDFLKVYDVPAYEEDGHSLSEWNWEVHADVDLISERCHWHHGLSGYEDLIYQFDYGINSISRKPEATTGWRSAKNTNVFLCSEDDGPIDNCRDRRRDRYRSCRIYETPPEIQEVISLLEGGVEVVKVIFKDRFHHHYGAAHSVARDRSTWNKPQLKAQSYRTLENALMEYLLYWNDGGHNGPHCVGGGANELSYNLGQQGNSAYIKLTQPNPWTEIAPPHGACFPDFGFVQLVPKPFDDGNDTQDIVDSPLWAAWWRDVEVRIRTMCEGFVDGVTSVSVGCDTGGNSLFCYTMQSLCFEALTHTDPDSGDIVKQKWLTTLPTFATSRIPRSQTRPDMPMGFGPLPNTTTSAEVYNQFAKCINKLNKVPIMLPTQFQVRSLGTGVGEAQVLATWPDSSVNCAVIDGVPSFPAHSYWTGVPPSAGTGTPGEWGDSLAGASSTVGASMVCDSCGDDGKFIVRTTRGDSEWRWRLTDPDAIFSIPELWRSMLFDSDGNMQANGRVLARQTTSTQRLTASRSDTAGPGLSSPCGPEDDGSRYNFWSDGGRYILFDGAEECTAPSCNVCIILPQSGVVSAPGFTGSCDLPFGGSGGQPCCLSAQNSRGISPIDGLDDGFGVDTTFIEIPLTPADDVTTFKIRYIDGSTSMIVGKYNPTTLMFEMTPESIGRLSIRYDTVGGVSWQGIVVNGEYSLLSNSNGSIYVKATGYDIGDAPHIEFETNGGTPIAHLSQAGRLDYSSLTVADPPSGTDRIRMFNKISFEPSGDIYAAEVKLIGLLSDHRGNYITNHFGRLFEMTPV